MRQYIRWFDSNHKITKFNAHLCYVQKHTILQYSCSAGLAPLQSVCTIDTKNVTTLKHPQKYPYSCVELGGRAVEGTSEASSYSEQDTKADQNDKRALASAYRLTKCWRFATVL